MAMEPISGVVAFQSQNYQTSGTETKPATAAGKTAEEFMDIPKESSAQQIDKTTVVVQTADEVGIRPDGGGKGFAREAEQKKKNENAVLENNEQILMKEHERIKEAVEEINKKMVNSEALFGIHEETNRVTIKIVDKESKEVLKEFPPEKSLDLLAKSLEMAGLLMDEKG